MGQYLAGMTHITPCSRSPQPALPGAASRHLHVFLSTGDYCILRSLPERHVAHGSLHRWLEMREGRLKVLHGYMGSCMQILAGSC